MKKIIDLIGWPAAAAVVIVLVVGLLGGLFGGWTILRQARDLADLNRTLAAERKEAATKAKVITQEDMARLISDNNVVIERRINAAAMETIRVIAAAANRPGAPPGPVIIERDVRAPTPPAPVPGPKGDPGTPGTPGTTGKDAPTLPTPTGPLIPAARAPAAREVAIERILAHFVPGSLLNCDTVGLEPNSVEFLRDPEGRLLSTARCVWRIQDQVKLTPPAPVTGPTFPRWEGRLLAGYNSSLQWIAGARLTRNLDRTWAVELEGGRQFSPAGWWWRIMGTWRAF